MGTERKAIEVACCMGFRSCAK